MIVKVGRRQILNRVATELGHFILVLIGGGVLVTYIISGEEASVVLAPTIPLLLAGGFLAIGLILGGRQWQ